MNPKIEEILKALRFEASIYVGSSTSIVCEVAADLIEQLQQELIDERYRHDRVQDFCVAQGEALSALKEQQRWIPVTERLPENGRAVLGICGRVGNPFVVRYDHKWDRWRVSGSVRVSHWMPLPEPPKEDEGA